MKHDDNTVEQILKLSKQGMSSRQISHALWGTPSKKSSVNDILSRMREDTGLVEAKDGANILFIDLEVSATIAATFPRFKANISPQAVIQEPYVLTAAWAKLNTSTPHNAEYDSLGLHQLPTWRDGDYANDILLIEQLWELLDEADIIIAHNASFDDGWMNTRFAYHGMSPPSPYKVVCTLKALRKHFSLPSNSLDSATRYFELERKLSTSGIGLWLDCMNGDSEAMNQLLEYNRGDIPTLVSLYYKVRPFMKNHPNVALHHNDDRVRCNSCGSDDMDKMVGKHAYTNLSKFETYRCGNCGSIKRSRKNVKTKEQMQYTLMNV